MANDSPDGLVEAELHCLGGTVAAGDHICVRRRGGYFHHGVEVANGQVIHLSGEPRSKQGATVRMDRMEDFLRGGQLRVVTYGRRLDSDVAVDRAESRLGERCYNLAKFNCEHFATWSVTGKARSGQVRTGAAAGGAGAAAGGGAAAGIGVVSGAGAVAGLSGSGIMSGLATAGAVVGGGAVAGLLVLGTLPAAASAGVMHFALRDDELATTSNRAARSAGRTASKAGALGGGAAGVGAVGALGSVGGLSAAGISSGLATIGGAVGGGMAAGSAIVIAAPAVAAAGVGYAAYRTVRWWKDK